MDSKPPDLVTWMTQVNKPGTFGIWPEVQLMGSDVVPAFPFYDGRTYQDRWAARITGNLFIEKTNTYTLELENREGAKLWVDGSLAVDNDFSVHETGETDMRSKHAHVHLSAGYHHVRIEFFVDQTWTGLRFWYGAPGVPRMIIPASAFSLPDASCCLCQCKRGQCRIADYGTKIVDCLWPTDAGPIDFCDRSPWNRLQILTTRARAKNRARIRARRQRRTRGRHPRTSTTDSEAPDVLDLR